MDHRVDQVEDRVFARQAQISRLWAEQVADLRELDRFQIDTTDGARTMGDWVASHLDLSHQTAYRLMTVANADDPEIDANLATGKWGLDRASLLVKLRHAGLLSCSPRPLRGIRWAGSMAWWIGYGI